MYKIFTMDGNGSLWELVLQYSLDGSIGFCWSRQNGWKIAFLHTATVVLEKYGTPPLPNGELLRDTYIGEVDVDGTIVRTHDLCDVLEG
jgi:hypothetical protein